MSTVQLFLSHSERDESLVRPLAGWLQTGLGLNDDDIRCTVVTNMDVGSLPAEVLRQDIASAKVLVGLLTANSLRSHWVQLELGAGWLQKRLHSIRGPGIRPSDLPSPLSDFTTVGYCEKDRMQSLLHQVASALGSSVRPEAEQELDNITRSAEEMLVADMVSWFSLPPVLSAWRIDRLRYEYALLSLCTQLALSDRDVRSCVSADGVITRAPDLLPFWAKDLWTVSASVVNFMLRGYTKVTDRSLDVPPGVLTDQLIANMKRALGSRDKRGPLIRKWFADTKRWIAENPPGATRYHSPIAHR